MSAVPTASRVASPDEAASPQRRHGSLLGHWNSVVTSYYVIVGASSLLLVIGLVMVLSSSSVESLDKSGNA